MLARRRAPLLLATVLLIVSGSVAAQSPTDSGAARPRVLVRGTVKDSAGIAIPGATILAHGLSISVTSNDSGVFSFGPFPSGPRKFEIRRLGFQPVTFEVNIPGDGPHELDIELLPLVQALAEVEVRRAAVVDLATTGFFARRTRYAGATFIEPEAIAKRHASYASQILESAPNVMLRGTVGRKRVLMRNGCDVAIFVDRRFVRSGRDRRGVEWGYFDDLVDAHDVYAVEIYSHPPPEFQAPDFPSQRFCGAVVIWTSLFDPKR